jgi:two-component system CheB/CheR fusion protein
MAKAPTARTSPRKSRTQMGSVSPRTTARSTPPFVSPPLPFPVVAIGASAGGLSAYTALLKALPSKPGMAFVLIQHLEPKHESALTNLLSKATSMPVVEVSDGTGVEPDHVYVIPPNKNMTIRAGSLLLGPRSEVPGLQLPIDHFCTALATEQGNAALGVVLSGTGSDGTQGLRAIKAAGGVTFAQTAKTAEWPAMPLSAIAAGSVDFVLSPKRIAAELIRIAQQPYLATASKGPQGGELDQICSILWSSLGIDFRLYKEATIRRRIARRMALRKIESMGQYAKILKQIPDEVSALVADIFIHVTSFFRDPKCFLALRKRVLATLCRRRAEAAPLRIWVPGCSTGEEVYSIAILLLEELGERASRTRIQIFGTDIQERSVEHARSGIYTEAAITGVSPTRLKRFFVKTDNEYQIQGLVRELCVFARHDVTKDPPFSQLDLISCRNVLIYMGPVLQRRTLCTFQRALNAGGFLFLGNSETINSYPEAFSPGDRKHRIFSPKPLKADFHEFDTPPDRIPKLGVARPTLKPARDDIDFQREAEALLLKHYAPPALIVDPDLEILHFQGDTSPYLAPAARQPSFHLLRMVRPELVVDVQMAIYQARRRSVAVHKEGVQFQHQGKPATVRLEARPLDKRKGQKQEFLVVFQNLTLARQDKEEHAEARGHKKRTVETTERLKRELASTRKHLRLLIAEHQIALAKMSVANEEIISGNEELQSTNDELETAREELQSSNEELHTLNNELQHRNTELDILVHELSNLLVGVDIPVLILDAGLRVRRFTPKAATLLNLIPSDLGRPFSNIASNLDVSDWKELFVQVTDRRRSVEREVSDANGHRYSMRVQPYRVEADRIEGVLIVILDTDLIYRQRDEAQASGDLARAELARSEVNIRALIECTPQFVIGVNADRNIVIATGRVEKTFGYRPEELIGQPLEILIPENARERHTEHQNDYFANMQNRPMGIGMDLLGRRKDGTTFPVEIGLSVLNTRENAIAVAFGNDITERRRLMDLLRQREQELDTVLNHTPDAIIRFDRDLCCEYVNERAAKEAGFQGETMLGKTLGELGLPQLLVDTVTRSVRSVFETGQPAVAELSYPSPAGVTYWETRFIPELGTNGAVQSVLAVGRDFTDRTRLEQVAQVRAEEIQALAASLMTAQEEERRRVSRELHDQICQQLGSLAIEIGEFAKQPLPEETQSRLRAFQGRVVATSEESRHIAYRLHPSILDDLGIVASLRSLCEAFSKDTKIAIQISTVGLPSSVPRELASCLYRVAQESLQNVARHASAKHVSFAVTARNKAVTLTIADDGVGFNLDAVKGRGGLGLVSMEERAQLVNAKLSIRTEPGHGTRIALEVLLPTTTDEASADSTG